MNNKQVDKLLDKLESGAYAAEEEQQVRAFIHNYNVDGDSGLTEEDFIEAKSQIWSAIQQSGLPKVKRLHMWRIIAAAAITIMIFGAGLFYFNSDDKQPGSNRTVHVIQPGKTGATLTLANGKQITLTDARNGQLANEAGVVITKSKNGELVYKVIAGNEESNGLNTLSTANGQTYQIHLPDGSLVQLNAASSLTYRTALVEDGKRVVRLSGEGYFEIAKDAAHPFIVKTGHQEVEVLGTHFNINAYDEEAVSKTTLLEGSIRLNKEATLKPGQQAIIRNNRVSVQQADIEEAVAWKNGEFFFDQENFVSTMNMIARWYDVEIVYDYKPVGLRLAGQISRTRAINEVLQILQNTEEVKFKIEGRRIRVIK